ncbi:conserved hypothetical protein [Theileria orientalis strain Shintoku]|uniref:Uncharacterized protein n=1 Tax=Theileria orientalis strain Shintoku TaxID=869250 RepID=J4CDX2_THEOR|nr:conserved hypothetical protein [Theileria orientalis strain Shintoku]BAM41887.1 conserved hypothetical protein [Theileria orientalis strain Shintoku]|eukprot:XP_009692188.1 conserved hypothetical protein [Theileria orientalis strain Shintoku]
MTNNQTNAATNQTSILHNAINKLDKSIGGHGGGEVITGFMALTLYMYIQIASIISRHMAVALCFKISRLWIFLLQLVMDLLIYDKPLLIVKIHYWLAYLLSLISTALWFYFCISRYNREAHKKSKAKSIPKLTEATEMVSQKTNDTECLSTSGQQANQDVENPSESTEEKIKETEPSFWTHLGNSFSPLMMSIVTMMMKNILFPGLLPYGLLERDKSHIINMVITPMGLMGTSIVHALKKNVDSINKRWEWYWHLLWLLAIPPAVIFYTTLDSMHPRSSAARSKIINNRNAVLAMAVVFHFCHSLIEAAGYLGVVSNVKHCNEVRERGKKMVSTNQLLAEIIHFIFYKISVGYNVTRIGLGYHLPKFRPTHRMSREHLYTYIVRETFVKGFDDFINDFKMNIRDQLQKYLKHSCNRKLPPKIQNSDKTYKYRYGNSQNSPIKVREVYVCKTKEGRAILHEYLLSNSCRNLIKKEKRVSEDHKLK